MNDECHMLWPYIQFQVQQADTHSLKRSGLQITNQCLCYTVVHQNKASQGCHAMAVAIQFKCTTHFHSFKTHLPWFACWQFTSYCQQEGTAGSKQDTCSLHHSREPSAEVVSHILIHMQCQMYATIM